MDWEVTSLVNSNSYKISDIILFFCQEYLVCRMVGNLKQKLEFVYKQPFAIMKTVYLAR